MLSPYGSASDLPSYKELARLIQGGKLLTRCIARHLHPEFFKIEQEFKHLVAIVDRFYEVFGSRNWIFHDSLSISAVEDILDQTETYEEAEQRLIEIYREKDFLALRTYQFYRLDALQVRAHQIERAREHYLADKFDSAALQLIAVMDGFVNDFEPDVRRGLASRDPDSMIAWDSVVGHHLGLTNALKAYNRTFKRRVDEEVYELHRHGIVHGTITRFDNVVVATKAWNMLFAVADWASATSKSRQPEAPEPTLWESLRQMAGNAGMKKKMEAWQSSILSASDPGFQDHEIHALTVEFLTGWRNRNFGILARLPSKQFADRESTPGQMAGRLRLAFEDFILSEFRITELENTAPAIWLSKGEATVNDVSGNFECRWIMEEVDGSFGYGSDSAHWRLVYCDPTVWRKRQ